MTTTEVSTLSERELDEAISIEMGWKKQDGLWVGPGGDWFDETNPLTGTFARYATSLDALGEVEARLREAGCALDSYVTADGANAEWYRLPGDAIVLAQADAPTEARARAEASLMALQALNSPTKEASDG